MTILETVYQAAWMQPMSLSFLCVLLPVFLFLYYLAPLRLRPGLLLLESLYYYSIISRQGGTGTVLVLLASATADYGLLRLMEYFDQEENRFPAQRERLRALCLGITVVKGLGIVIGGEIITRKLHMPQLLGIQVFTFAGIRCMADAYHRVPIGGADEDLCYERNFIRFVLHQAFFPALYAGPLVSHREFNDQLADLRMKPGPMLTGVGQLVHGVFKTGILGNSLYDLYTITAGLADPTILSSWLHVFSLAFSLYFMLSGFSDIAQGLGALFGIALPRNFYYPYQSRSVGDFLERFNITVSSFLRANVQLPGQPGRERLSEVLNTLLIGGLMGLWLGARLNYVLWGLYIALFILMERYLYPKLLEATPMLFRRVFTLCVVLAGFTIIATSTPWQTVQLIGSLFRFSSFYDEQALYLLTSNWLLLIISTFFATNAVNLIATRLRRRFVKLSGLVFGAVDLGVLLVYLALRMA